MSARTRIPGSSVCLDYNSQLYQEVVSSIVSDNDDLTSMLVLCHALPRAHDVCFPPHTAWSDPLVPCSSSLAHRSRCRCASGDLRARCDACALGQAARARTQHAYHELCCTSTCALRQAAWATLGCRPQGPPDPSVCACCCQPVEAGHLRRSFPGDVAALCRP